MRFEKIKVFTLFIIVFIILIYYHKTLFWKVDAQVNGFKNNTYIPNSYYDVKVDKLARLTNNSKKLFFMNICNELQYYYQMGIPVTGYYLPYPSWVFKKDLIDHLNVLLSNNYILVVSKLNNNCMGVDCNSLDL